MNKFTKTLLITGVVAVSCSTVFAASPSKGQVFAAQNSMSIERQISSQATLKSDQQSVDYSKFLENGGGELWVKLTLEGAEFNTKDPNKIKNAITQNYDIQTSLAVGNDGKSIEFGVYAPNASITYLENWEISINSSVLTSENNVKVSIPVNNDIELSKTPKVITNKTSVTVDELVNGFNITLEGINGAKFNTSCAANYVRQSIMQTSNIDVYAIPYCDLTQTKMTFNIRALNGVSIYRDTLEFRIEGMATNSQVPLIVKIPIQR